ncbi:hypothetical protein NM688_g9156 [Phlebia brevispora]|uniref:Uncharacterized protein n=1 Tax=Phlebia brevispora TaxID=194682 RepID=A0ACC1RK27_9APHY|nr:hypothetical protein NM688_g9156 [Phlebia brevispora]
MVFSGSPNPETEEWVKTWEQTAAKGKQQLIDTPVVAVDADTSVEEACEVLLSKDVPCIAVNRSSSNSPHESPFLGLFDYPDVNAFLTLAATRHRWSSTALREHPRTEEIIAAAKAGRVPVSLVSNLSDKNPLEILPHDATIISLLTVFSKGTHRVLIKAAPPSQEFLGMVSDRSLLEWFTIQAQKTPSLSNFLSTPLSFLSLPSLYLYSAVIAAKATDTVLDAMRLMSDYGVSSVAVMQEDGGGLLSAVSVTDIGKLVVPSQSNQILSTPLHQFISAIKEPDGSTDGADKYPVYSVTPNINLLFAMQKILASAFSILEFPCHLTNTTEYEANSHRLFVADDSLPAPPSVPASLSGVVSIVDVLALFARIANIPDVDPTAMQRHRRASSSSGSSVKSGRSPVHSTFGPRSRSSSRTSLNKRLSLSSSPPVSMPLSVSPGLSGSFTGLDTLQWSTERPAKSP